MYLLEMDDPKIITPNPLLPANYFDDKKYIEHPCLPPMRCNNKKERREQWVWIGAVIGDIDMNAEPEIDLSNTSIPNLFKYKIPADKITCLTEHQYLQNMERISKERKRRMKTFNKQYNRDRHEMLKIEKNKYKNLINYTTNAS